MPQGFPEEIPSCEPRRERPHTGACAQQDGTAALRGQPLGFALGELTPSSNTITGRRLLPGVFLYPQADGLIESFKILRLTD